MSKRDSTGAIKDKEEKIDPIPLPLYHQNVTFLLRNSRFVTITSDSPLYWQPSMCLFGIFPNQQFNVITSMKSVFPFMKLSPIKTCISNYVFLTSETAVEGSTPTSRTAITKQMALLHVSPSEPNVQQYKIQDTLNNFAQAKLITANANVQNAAPFVPLDEIDTNINGWRINIPNPDAKVSPSTTYAGGKVGNINAVLAAGGYPRHVEIMNRGQFDFITADEPFELVSKGEHIGTWLSSVNNYFGTPVNSGTATFYHLPGKYRPLEDRSEGFDTTLNLRHAHNANLKHHIIAFPPIETESGTTLPQSCTFLSETTMTIELSRREDAATPSDPNAKPWSEKLWLPSTAPVTGTTTSERIVLSNFWQ